MDTSALPPNVAHQRYTYEKGKAEQDAIDRYRVVVEDFVGKSVEGRLREIEEAGETDNETVDFAECGEAEDFSGIIPFLQDILISFHDCGEMKGFRETYETVV